MDRNGRWKRGYGSKWEMEMRVWVEMGDGNEAMDLIGRWK